MADDLLKKGDEGDAVRTLQQDLNTLGWLLKVDGVFGPTTEEVVKDAQQQNGIRVDGIVGPQTRAALVQQSQDEQLLSKGASNDAVRQVQTILTSNGFALGAVDGVYGDATLAAVKVFQERHGLKVDGVVGPKTWRALKSL